MVSVCSDCVDYNFEDTKSDLKNKRVSYQLHHQQVFSNNEGYNKDQVCATSSEVDHVNLRISSKEEIDRVTLGMISHVYSNYNLRN